MLPVRRRGLFEPEAVRLACPSGSSRSNGLAVAFGASTDWQTAARAMMGIVALWHG